MVIKLDLYQLFITTLCVSNIHEHISEQLQNTPTPRAAGFFACQRNVLYFLSLLLIIKNKDFYFSL